MSETTNGNSRPEIVDADVRSSYANFGRVSSTPEEVILDFGLNPNPPNAAEPRAIQVTDRIILNHFTAKRIAMALSMAIERHERTFGPLELDINKRIVGGVPASEAGNDAPQ